MLGGIDSVADSIANCNYSNEQPLSNRDCSFHSLQFLFPDLIARIYLVLNPFLSTGQRQGCDSRDLKSSEGRRDLLVLQRTSIAQT